MVKTLLILSFLISLEARAGMSYSAHAAHAPDCAPQVQQVGLFNTVANLLLGDFVCPEADTKEFKVDARPENEPVPEWIDEKVAPAVATILITAKIKPTRTNPSDLKITGMGSGFAVKQGEEVSWITAAHVTPKFKNGDRLVVIPSRRKVDLELLSSRSGEADLVGYKEDGRNPYFGSVGFDISQIKGKSVKFNSPADQAAVKPLEVRDLENEPLALNEPVYLVGMQGGQLRKYSCANRGFDSSHFADYDNLNVYTACGGLPLDPRDKAPLLGFISGGVGVDRNGQAVGVFNGYDFDKKGNPYIRFSPLYKSADKDGGFQPFPALDNNENSVRCVPCYSHTDVEETDFTTKKLCALSYRNKMKGYYFRWK